MIPVSLLVLLAGFLLVLLLVLWGSRVLLSDERSRRSAIAQLVMDRARTEDGKSYTWVQDSLAVRLTVGSRSLPEFHIGVGAGLPATFFAPHSALEAGTIVAPEGMVEVPRHRNSSYSFFSTVPDTLEHFLSRGLARKAETTVALQFSLSPNGTLTVKPASRFAVTTQRDLHDMLLASLSVAEIFAGRRP